MIQLRSILKVADNSGGQTVRCIQIMGGHYRRYGQIGNTIVASVQTSKPRKTVKKKDVVKCIIVRQRRNFKRKNGTYISFDDNAVVIINDKKEPVATRIFGPIPREIKDMGYNKIIELGPELV
jgi:large subunit ribosomal protein L14